MRNLRRTLATSDHWFARMSRALRSRAERFTLPIPTLFVRPLVVGFVAARELYWWGKRVAICQPYFKSYCTESGVGLRTSTFLHWIRGKGRLIVGNDVLIDGKCGVSFAARFSDSPTLKIGDRTEIGHNCSFTVAKQIVIGRDCHVASDVWFFDASGHPTDPEARRLGLPTPEAEVRPVTIGNDVWIGRRCVIFPGVTIGDGSVVSAASVVMQDVAPYTVVAGNPARRIASVQRPPDGETREPVRLVAQGSEESPK
jgi:acetyltransferase-like isoleucine patch superfamily enzyme